MSRFYQSALAAILLTLISSASTAAIYKWKDEQGQVHYGSAPPSGTSVQKMGVSTHFSTVPAAKAKTAPKAAADKTKKADPDTDKKDPYTQKQHDSLCNKATKDIATLNQGGRLRVKQEDGSSQVMTDKNRSKRQETMQKMIKKHCK